MTVVGRLLSRFLFGPEPDPPFQVRPRAEVGPEVTRLPIDRTRWSALGTNILKLGLLIGRQPR